MEKLNGTIEIKVNTKIHCIKIIDKKVGTVQDRFTFEDSVDFCQWVLGLARDMGISRFEFASACNKASNKIDGWDNL